MRTKQPQRREQRRSESKRLKNKTRREEEEAKRSDFGRELRREERKEPGMAGMPEFN